MLVRLMIELALTLCRDSYYNMLRFIYMDMQTADEPDTATIVVKLRRRPLKHIANSLL